VDGRESKGRRAQECSCGEVGGAVNFFDVLARGFRCWLAKGGPEAEEMQGYAR